MKIVKPSQKLFVQKRRKWTLSVGLSFFCPVIVISRLKFSPTFWCTSIASFCLLMHPSQVQLSFQVYNLILRLSNINFARLCSNYTKYFSKCWCVGQFHTWNLRRLEFTSLTMRVFVRRITSKRPFFPYNVYLCFGRNNNHNHFPTPQIRLPHASEFQFSSTLVNATRSSH